MSDWHQCSNWNLKPNGSVAWRSNILNPDSKFRWNDHTVNFNFSGNCNCGCDGGMSWAGALISGGIGLGLSAFGMWAMSKMSRGRQQAPQLSLPQQLQQAYLQGYNSYKPTITITPQQVQQQVQQQVPQQVQQVQQAQQQVQQVQNNNNNNTVQNVADNTASTTGEVDATARNGNNEGITGKAKVVPPAGKTEVEYDADKGNFPKNFTITDKTHNSKGNVYTYTLVGTETSGDKKLPKYQCTKAEIYVVANTSVTFTSNTFTINDISCFTKQDDGKMKLTGNITDMSTTGKPTITPIKNLNGGTQLLKFGQ